LESRRRFMHPDRLAGVRVVARAPEPAVLADIDIPDDKIATASKTDLLRYVSVFNGLKTTGLDRAGLRELVIDIKAKDETFVPMLHLGVASFVTSGDQRLSPDFWAQRYDLDKSLHLRRGSRYYPRDVSTRA